MFIPKNRISTTKCLLYILAFVSVIFSGCKKKKVHCEDLISAIPYHVAFVGFQADVLDTILVHRFKDPGDSNVKYPVSDSVVVITNDTSNTLLYFHPGWTYEISFLNDSRIFELKDPQYPKGETWYAENCNSARASVSPPTAITVNGQVQSFKIAGPNKAVVYLK